METGSTEAAQRAYATGRLHVASEFIALLNSVVSLSLVVEDLARPEPVSAWVQHAKTLRAMLIRAAELSARLPIQTEAHDAAQAAPPGEEWIEVSTDSDGRDEPSLQTSPVGEDDEAESDDDRLLAWKINAVSDATGEFLGRFATEWIVQDGGVEVRIEAGPGDTFPAKLVLLGRGLRGVLGLAFAVAVTSRRGTFLCSFCHEPYSPQWSPDLPTKQVRHPSRTGSRANYCPACRADNYRVVKAARARENYWACEAGKGAAQFDLKAQLSLAEHDQCMARSNRRPVMRWPWTSSISRHGMRELLRDVEGW